MSVHLPLWFYFIANIPTHKVFFCCKLSSSLKYKSTYNSFSLSQVLNRVSIPKPSRTVHLLHSHLNPFLRSVKVILKGDFESVHLLFPLGMAEMPVSVAVIVAVKTELTFRNEPRTGTTAVKRGQHFYVQSIVL